MSIDGPDARLTGDMQILVRDLTEKRLAIFFRQVYILLGIGIVLLVPATLFIGNVARLHISETIEAELRQKSQQEFNRFEQELARVRTESVRSHDSIQSAMDGLLRDTDRRISDVRKSLTSAVAELEEWRTTSGQLLVDARARLTEADLVASSLRNDMARSAEIAENAVRHSEQVLGQIERLRATLAATESVHNALSEVADVAQALASSEPFQEAVLQRLAAGTHQQFIFRGDVQMLGKLIIKDIADSSIATTIGPGTIQFDGTQGGTLLGASIKIAGSTHNQGHLSVLDRHGANGVLITYNGFESGYPNGGMILLNGIDANSGPKAGIFLGTNKKYKMAVTDANGQWE